MRRVLASNGGACYCNKIQRNMSQEPQKETLEGVVAPEPPPAPEPKDAPEEPTQVLRPEDEALVAERLRDLGYIE